MPGRFELRLCAAAVFSTITLAFAAAAQPVPVRTVRHSVQTQNGKKVLVLDAAQPERGHHPTRLIVRFVPGAAPDFLPGSQNARALGRIPNLYTVHVPPGLSVDEAVSRYRARASVLYAEPDIAISVATTPNDPRWPEQWDMVKVAAPAAWDLLTDSSDVVVAVVDTGIDFTHPDLAPNLWTDPTDGSHGFTAIGGVVTPGGADDFGHGTHVAGTIGARGNDGTGVAGVAWHIQLLSAKFLDQYGSGYTSDAVLVFDQLVALRQRGVNVRVTNNSWGFSGDPSQALQDAMDQATAAGMLHVCAAGNSRFDIDTNPFYPAGYPSHSIISVGATDPNDLPANFSNFGTAGVDLFAPGTSILSTVPTGTCTYCDPTGYRLLSGTSMASPHVAGAAAAVFHINPALTPEQAHDVLLDPGSVDYLTSTWVQLFSTTHGRLNLAKTFSSPGVFSPVTNHFPQINSVPTMVTRAASNAVSLQANITDADGDSLNIEWQHPHTGYFLYSAALWSALPPCSCYPPIATINPLTFTAPRFALTASTEFQVAANDSRGGSVLSPPVWVNILGALNPGAPPTASISASATDAPVGTTITFTGTGSDPENGTMAVGYFGSTTGTCCWGSGSAFSVNFGYAGAFRQNVHIVDSELNLSNWATTVVRIGGATGTPPIADLVMDKSKGTAPLTVNWDASGSQVFDGASLTYFVECEAWTHGVLSANPPTGSCTFTTPGPHSIGVHLYDSNQLAEDRVYEVMVNPAIPPDTTAPTVSLTAPAGGAQLCSVVSVSATAADDVGIDHVDFLLDGTIVIGQARSAPYSIAWDSRTVSVGSHTLSAKAYDASGNTAVTPALSVTVNTPPAATITASGPTTFCAGGSVTLTAPTSASYLWSNGAATQSISVNNSGSYSVTVTDATGCQATSASTPVTVNDNPSTPVVTASGPATFCAGGSVTLTAPTSTSYLWSNGATTQAITVTTSGSYSVIVTNANGCTATSVPTTVVNASPSTPVITASGPTTFCAGGSVTLTAPTSASYLWSNGTTTQSITVNNSGSYSVEVTNASGCQATSASTTVTVNANPSTPVVTGSGPATFCAGGSVTLTAPTSTSYLWSNGATTQAITVSTSGSYGVTVANASGCTATSAPTTVTVNANPSAPVITASGPTTFCAGGSVTLTSTSAASYLWSNGATTQAIAVTASGNYSVTVTNASGCPATSTSTTVTNSGPATPVVAASGPTTFCAGGSVTLTAPSSTTYHWSNGANTQSITVTASGSFSVTVKNASGCSATSGSTAVTVNANPAKPTISASGPTTFCAGGSVTLTASSATSYHWSDGATTQAITVTTGGSYSVTVMNASGCPATSSPTTVTVSSTPVITSFGPASQTVLKGQPPTAITVSATGTGTMKYQWFKGTSGITTSSIGGANSASYNPPTGTQGTFSYWVRVTIGSCTANSPTATVTVQ
jgi:subtilisin family serine protease